jgi:NTE family protein
MLLGCRQDAGVISTPIARRPGRKRIVELGNGETEASDQTIWKCVTAMNRLRILLLTVLAALFGLGGCATAPINPPITRADPNAGYRFETRTQYARNKEDIVVLAFSGGGTRAAAFSYGVLEILRNTEVMGRDGRRERLLDWVDVITGVSGGSFTALAYGLYGDQLFSEYEQRFLKRDVQGELIGRALNPVYWGQLSSPYFGRSELAADLYDEILFNGATFANLQRGSGPMIVASATDLNSGARFYFTQKMFDILCSDLSAVRLSRAAAASSGVPVVLSPVTIDNYAGTCGYKEPPFLARIEKSANVARPAARAIQDMKELRYYEDGRQRPYLHLVDGGVADNLAMREILAILEELEALHLEGLPTPLDHAKRLALFVVNSLSTPPLDWDQKRSTPDTVEVLLQATGVPIDHYSYETVELLRDTAARWKMLRAVRDSGVIPGKDKRDPVLAEVERVPNLEVYVINVSFAELKDTMERAYLNDQPTSFVLPPEAVDRLRAAAGRIVLESPDFQRYLNDLGDRVVKAATPARPAPAP